MAEKFLIDVGFVPEESSSDLIMCGDPEGSGTKEVNLEWIGDEICSPGNSAKVKVAVGDNIWKADAKIWKDLADTFLSDLSANKKIDPRKLASCWAVFQDEDPPDKSVRLVSEENGGGEFRNDDGEYNGHFYVRYQVEEDDSYFGEKIVVFK
ncbi:MAG: hypothetical protein FGM15_03415 [Chthoniobacterales bacterium]|nr:hypothetical protein [Chthoniobacterales bacterium]